MTSLCRVSDAIPRIAAAALVAIAVIPIVSTPGAADWRTFLKIERVTPDGDSPSRLPSDDGSLLDHITRHAHLFPQGHFIVTFRDDEARLVLHTASGRYRTHTIADKVSFAQLWRDASLGDAVIPENDLSHLWSWLPDDGGERRFFVLNRSGSVTEGRLLTTGGRSRILLRLSDHIEYDLSPGASMTGVRDMLGVPFSRSSVRVVSLFDDRDVDVLSVLDNAAGDTHSILPDISAPELTRITEPARRGLLVLVGHVEDGAFVVRAPDGSVRSSMKLAEIERILGEHDATGLFLGCETAAIGLSGFPHCVNVVNVAQGLRRLQSAASYGDLLDGIAASAEGLVLEAKLVDGTLRAFEARRRSDLLDRRLDQGWFVLRLTASDLRRGKSNDEVLGARKQIFFLMSLFFSFWTAALMWCLGLIFGFFAIRGEWRDYREHFPVQASALSSRLRNFIIRVGRFVVFFMFVPLLYILDGMILLACGIIMLFAVIEGWTGGLLLAFVAAVAHVAVARERRGWIRTAKGEWRSAAMAGGIGLWGAVLVFDRPVSVDAGMVPPHEAEEAALLAVAALVSAILILIRRRWSLGASELPAGLFFVCVFSVAEWIDRRSRRFARLAS